MNVHASPLMLPMAVLSQVPIGSAAVVLQSVAGTTNWEAVVLAIGTAIVGIIGAVGLYQQRRTREVVGDVKKEVVVVREQSDGNTTAMLTKMKSLEDRLDAVLERERKGYEQREQASAIKEATLAGAAASVAPAATVPQVKAAAAEGAGEALDVHTEKPAGEPGTHPDHPGHVEGDTKA